MQKMITHPVATRLIRDIVDLIPELAQGTYNAADPTAYSKGATLFEGLIIKYYDCTWGVELSIYTSLRGGKYQGRELASIYLTDEEKPRIWSEERQKWLYNGSYAVLIPRNNWCNQWFKLLYDARHSLRRAKKLNLHPQDAECWGI